MIKILQTVTNPSVREIKKFSTLEKASVKRGCGGIVCLCEEVIPIDENDCFVPCNLL